MSAQITITVSDDALQRARHLSQRTGRQVGEILAETIELSLNPLGTAANGEKPLSEWSDEEVLAAVDSTLSTAEDARLSELLDSQQADSLTTAEKSELTALMQLYQNGLLRKAQALREAVHRGLREPLSP